jgi:hypothetical protein
VKSHYQFAISLLAVLCLGVQASSKVTDQDEIVTEKIPKPGHIWVYDFAATPADLPPDSDLVSHISADAPAQTQEQIDNGRKVGAELAKELAAQINAMGMPANQVSADTRPAINDIVIQGYLVSVTEGDAKKRVSLGFSSGASELKILVEGFQVTPQGLRKLGGGASESTSSKKPGAALGLVGVVAMHNPLGLIVSAGMKEHGEKTGSSTMSGRIKETASEISGILQKRFQEQGWI